MSAGTLTAQSITSTMTHAEFRAFGAHIASILDAAGFARTADTGQIDWSTVNYPVSNTTFAGYEIRAMGDTIQGTAPIVIKLNYGRGSSASTFTIGITIGTGSNGSGTITGQQLTETSYTLANTAATDWNLAVSAGQNRFAMMFYRNPTGTQCDVMALERTADAAGAPTSQGCLLWVGGSSGIAINQRYIPRTGSVPALESVSGVFPAAQQTTGLHSSSDVAVYPAHFYGIGEMMQPSLNMVGCYTTNFPTAGADHTIVLRGVSMTMKRCFFNASSHNATTVNRAGSVSIANFNMLMRYD